MKQYPICFSIDWQRNQTQVKYGATRYLSGIVRCRTRRRKTMCSYSCLLSTRVYLGLNNKFHDASHGLFRLVSIHPTHRDADVKLDLTPENAPFVTFLRWAFTSRYSVKFYWSTFNDALWRIHCIWGQQCLSNYSNAQDTLRKSDGDATSTDVSTQCRRAWLKFSMRLPWF